MNVYSFRFPFSCLSFIEFLLRKSKSIASAQEKKSTEKNRQSLKRNLHSLGLWHYFCSLLVACLSLSLSLSLVYVFVILNFDAGTFCALAWAPFKDLHARSLGTCFAILLAQLGAPARCQLPVGPCCLFSCCSCVVSHLYGHHKL